MKTTEGIKMLSKANKLEILKELQWQEYSDEFGNWDMECSYCKGDERKGHEKDCKVQLFIDEIERGN